MPPVLSKLWSDFVAPLISRPPRYQVAALCYRLTETGPEILLITSLTTRRWILPKGWPKAGYDAGGTALEEAWEEAGIKPAHGKPRLIGKYRYSKVLRGGVPVRTDVDVFAIRIEKLHDDFPEADRRERRWVTPEDAAEMVDEEELKALLAELPERLNTTLNG
ncbi:MAG: NUDIX hydrolase [Pseudooceanicola sp.]